MENIKFEITAKDIQKYLNKYQKYYKYCEALFIKYLKDNQGTLTEEMLEILLKDNDKFAYNIELPSFNPYPTTIQNLDLSGICHILMPTINLYSCSKNNVFTSYNLYANLCIIAEKLNVPLIEPWKVLESTIENYQICGKIQKMDRVKLTFKMGRDQSRSELMIYSQFYDEDKVKKIRKIVREEFK